MKKIMKSFLVAALVCASAASSLAYTFTVTPLCDPNLTGDFCIPGVTTTAGLFRSELLPFPPDTLTPPPGAPGSGFSLFLIQTTPTFIPPPPPPQATDTFNAATSYFFDVNIDAGPAHRFRVDGTVTGPVTLDVGAAPGTFVGGSNAFFQATLITDTNTGISSALFAISPDAKESLLLPAINFGNGVGDLFVDFRQRITPPLGNPSSIGGFFGNVIPEPGTLGLLIGTGIGGLLVLRRRRA